MNPKDQHDWAKHHRARHDALVARLNKEFFASKQVRSWTPPNPPSLLRIVLVVSCLLGFAALAWQLGSEVVR